jgi:hypothetical protein
MTSKDTKAFDSVAFFRSVKEKMAEEMQGMTLNQKKSFMRQVREGKIKLSLSIPAHG